jgi:hypothetical protein
MPLEPFRRGPTWWARGRVEYLGAPITDYYRCSTGASEEAGAWDWCRAEEERQPSRPRRRRRARSHRPNSHSLMLCFSTSRAKRMLGISFQS